MGNVLSGRVAGIPNIVLIGVAGIAIWFLFLRGKAATPTAKATSPTGQATTDYSLGYAQGIQAAGVNTAPPAATAGAPSALAWQFGQPPADPSTWVWRLTQGGQSQYASTYGTNWSGGVQPGTAPVPQGLGEFSWQWAPVPPGTNVAQLQGMGGPARARSVGSRSKAPEWHEAHPKIGAPVLYPHYVRAVGGPRAHRAEIHRVARAAGVHPARVAMLNPTPTGRIRIA